MKILIDSHSFFYILSSISKQTNAPIRPRSLVRRRRRRRRRQELCLSLSHRRLYRHHHHHLRHSIKASSHFILFVVTHAILFDDEQFSCFIKAISLHKLTCKRH